MENNDVIRLEIDPYLMKKMSFIGTVQKVFGVLAIIGGAISCLGIITAIIGIPYILVGIKLFSSGSGFSYAAYSNDGTFLRNAILNLASYWMYMIISIICIIVCYIALIFVFFLYLSSGYGYYY